MADEMPDGVEIAHFREFRFPLLNAALAEVARASGVSFADERGGKSFRDGDERDVFGAAAGAGRGFGDALVRFREIGGHGGMRAIHGAHFIRKGGSAKRRPRIGRRDERMCGGPITRVAA